MENPKDNFPGNPVNIEGKFNGPQGIFNAIIKLAFEVRTVSLVLFAKDDDLGSSKARAEARRRLGL
jgi:hypothetical protein